MLQLTKFKTKKSNVLKKEYNTSEFIPYAHYWNDTTLLTKDNWMLKVIKLGGYAFETADDEDVDIQKTLRNQLLKGIGSGSCALYFHIIRKKQNVFTQGFAVKRLPNFFADYVNELWKEKHKKKKSFANELYITVIRKFDTKGAAIVSHLLKRFSHAASKGAWEADMRDAHEELEEMASRVVTSLRYYSPKILGIKKAKHGVMSEILSFMSKIVNCGKSPNELLLPVINIAEYLPLNRFYFGNKSFEMVTPKGNYYGGIVSLKEYGQSTSAGMLDVFLQLPYELIITQTFQFTNRQIAINKMQIQQNRMIQSADKAISQVAEITKALDDAMSGRIAFGEHHLTVLCIQPTLRSLENALSLVESELSNTGVYAVREKVNLEPAFWAQLPANFEYIVRKAVISTLNFAGFASLHNYPLGSPFGNFWGEAVTVFDTTSGTPFFFNFHVRDVGHSMIIGPTGAGKTVLMNFLCAQAMKFRPRLFFFDKDRGAEIFIRALGGIYTVIEARTKANLNPLQLEDTPDNRTFIADWLKQLVSTNGEVISSEDIERITDVINGNFKLDKKDRVLSNLIPFLGVGGPGTLANRIGMWYGDGSHASLFDNEEDKLNLNKASVFGFEMSLLLKDQAALGPVLLYIFHKISISLDGSPSMIVLDEAWALIDNEIFAPKIKDWLKVLRKLNTFVIFATQSVEDASKSKISDTLIQQTATQIFLPNLKATSVYRNIFMLSEREFVIIKHTDPVSRFFLIKQAIDAVVARIDLSGMENVINVLSGRAETVILLREIREELGDDPGAWLPVFYERVKNV
ncbi:MAG: VirB4 family type IV secretion/conjugal transfer ATPase [Rickettsiaceae bacterium H1]|nr:VirB4 family type IV secretion/conjugal transfer ATPase [Rickettsiaceae bacterium H1]